MVEKGLGGDIYAILFRELEEAVNKYRDAREKYEVHRKSFPGQLSSFPVSSSSTLRRVSDAHVRNLSELFNSAGEFDSSVTRLLAIRGLAEKLVKVANSEPAITLRKWLEENGENAAAIGRYSALYHARNIAASILDGYIDSIG